MELAKFFTGLALVSLSVSAGAATINIAMHNGATTVAGMTSRPAGTIVDTAAETWNNPARNGAGGTGLSFTDFALDDSTGAASGASLAATSGFTTFNSNPWGTNSQDYVMMEGWYGFRDAEFFTVSNLPAAFTTSGYTVTIYGDVAQVRTMDYTIGTSTQTIVDDGSVFAGTFSPENTTTFTGLTGSSFTITGNTTSAGRAAINGIIIQSIPEPGSATLGLLAASLLVFRRRR